MARTVREADYIWDVETRCNRGVTCKTELIKTMDRIRNPQIWFVKSKEFDFI